jgi:Subtilase family
MKRELPHIKNEVNPEVLGFTSVSSGGSGFEIPPRNRISHGERIQNHLRDAWANANTEKIAVHSTRTGTYLEFESSPDFNLVVKSLEDARYSVRLCNVREAGIVKDDGTRHSTQFATVFVPNGMEKVFESKINDYLTKNTKTEKPKNKPLIESIEELRNALSVDSFWTDDRSLIPAADAEWCEIWLRKENVEVIGEFEHYIQSKKIEAKAGILNFPERAVKVIKANREQLSELTRNFAFIAEYRKAKTTADFILSMKPSDQSDWAKDLLTRTTFSNTNNVSICLLDHGVNNGHPLLQNVLSINDCNTISTSWGTSDGHPHGHGTSMAGLLAYGDLKEKLETPDHLSINHALESIKIFPPKGSNPAELWGYITQQAVNIAEIGAPERKRITCLPATSSDTRDRGRPTSWSAAIDQMSFGEVENSQRLVFIASGNFDSSENYIPYPDSLLTDSVHDPAQSWNAVTVGSYTEYDHISDSTYSGYTPIAGKGQISPFTTTSLTWEAKWPIKPEVVFEGGNAGIEKSTNFCTTMDDLSLISTHFDFNARQFSDFSMTSASVALAANFAAKIMCAYPSYWPETIRALVIHSAEWPNALKSQIIGTSNNKSEFGKLLRVCGYGLPNLERALYCAANSLTLVNEAEITPFKKDGSSYKTNEMHFYDLPWPTEILENLGEANVEMRITLSYFIEPAPGEIGWKDRYRYQSHALRFDVCSPGEDKSTFLKRINKQSREEDDEKVTSSSASSHWTIGAQQRNKGSVHSDIWSGTAAELASSNLISVYPVVGWWRERHNLEKYNNSTRYSLIVSISTPENDVDIYTPVKAKISLPVPIQV